MTHRLSHDKSDNGQLLHSIETRAGAYLDAYNAAVELYFMRDLQAWHTLLAFDQRFALRPWKGGSSNTSLRMIRDR